MPGLRYVCRKSINRRLRSSRRVTRLRLRGRLCELVAGLVSCSETASRPAANLRARQPEKGPRVRLMETSRSGLRHASRFTATRGKQPRPTWLAPRMLAFDRGGDGAAEVGTLTALLGEYPGGSSGEWLAEAKLHREVQIHETNVGNHDPARKRGEDTGARL